MVKSFVIFVPGVESGNVLSRESALTSCESGHEEVLDGDERRSDGFVEQAFGHRRREDIPERHVTLCYIK